jgi:hypothetical protein
MTKCSVLFDCEAFSVLSVYIPHFSNCNFTLIAPWDPVFLRCIYLAFIPIDFSFLTTPTPSEVNTCGHLEHLEALLYLRCPLFTNTPLLLLGEVYINHLPVLKTFPASSIFWPQGETVLPQPTHSPRTRHHFSPQSQYTFWDLLTAQGGFLQPVLHPACLWGLLRFLDLAPDQMYLPLPMKGFNLLHWFPCPSTWFWAAKNITTFFWGKIRDLRTILFVF